MQLTKIDCLNQAAADWRAWELAKQLALYYLDRKDTLTAQSYNEQAAARKESTENWEQRAKELE